jgi:hypothetical protein
LIVAAIARQCSVSANFPNTRNVDASELRECRHVSDGFGDDLLSITFKLSLSEQRNVTARVFGYLLSASPDLCFHCLLCPIVGYRHDSQRVLVIDFA